jgi:hypothetical protein
MAKRNRRKMAAPAAKGNGDVLSSFLASVDKFTETISGQAMAAAGKGEEQLTIQSTAESFVAQTRKLTDYVREAATGIAPGQRRELDQFLRVQDGDAIVSRALSVSTKVLSPGGGPVTMSFLSWLDQHMKQIKKIIMEILQLIFHKLPEWVDTVFDIIDELLNLLKSLLGVRYGLKMSEVADQASREEVNFLHEMTALAGLQAARMPRRTADDESSNKRNGS